MKYEHFDEEKKKKWKKLISHKFADCWNSHMFKEAAWNVGPDGTKQVCNMDTKGWDLVCVPYVFPQMVKSDVGG